MEYYTKDEYAAAKNADVAEFLLRSGYELTRAGEPPVANFVRMKLGCSVTLPSPENIERARSVLKAEIDLYDCYLRGECYGFQLFEDGEELDSCWGFLGSFGEAVAAIREYLPETAVALADEVRYGDHDEVYEPDEEPDYEQFAMEF